MIVLGVNAFHADAAACVLCDGRLVAAAEEERFRRIKHWAGFPSEAIGYCLREAGASLRDVDCVAVNQDTRANFWPRMAYLMRQRPAPSVIAGRLRHRAHRMGIAKHLAGLPGGDGLRAQVQGIEHHLCHLASAYYGASFTDAAAVSIDGFGDFASAAWGHGLGTRLAVDGRVLFPHSLGILYQAITQFLGFDRYGDEYKVMGLAPCGRPSVRGQLAQLVELEKGGAFRLRLRYFRHASEHAAFQWADGEPRFEALYSDELADLLGPARRPDDALSDRHRDIACSVQQVYEEALWHVLEAVHERYRTPALVLSGGCAMNSVANGKIFARTPFRALHVQPAAGDAGGAIGAARVAWQRMRPGGNGAPDADGEVHGAYLGPAFAPAQVAGAISERRAELDALGCIVQEIGDEESLCTQVARRIASGEVVGWFQGRMEWGPRALGNRSILGDPRRGDMKERLNAKIKRRESFRPFAPSILREAVHDWFEVDADVPFMSQVLPLRRDKRALVPAVCHVDGTGRLQTVTRAANSRYHRLISAFASATGVPMVLNTSFNESEPIVCTPAEAIDCFVRTRMDCLVLGEQLIHRDAPTGRAAV